jgi:hypothetical protein
MPSGYENSPDYGGPEPKPWLWLLSAVLLALLAGSYWYLGR